MNIKILNLRFYSQIRFNLKEKEKKINCDMVLRHIYKFARFHQFYGF